MNVGARPGLRAASLLVLAVVVSIALTATAPSHARHRSVPTRHAQRVRVAAALIPPPPAPKLRTAARIRLHPDLSTPYNSVVRHLKGHLFVEDTPPPSSETLEHAQLQAPMEPSLLPRPPSFPLVKRLASVANRQRAP